MQPDRLVTTTEETRSGIECTVVTWKQTVYFEIIVICGMASDELKHSVRKMDRDNCACLLESTTGSLFSVSRAEKKNGFIILDHEMELEGCGGLNRRVPTVPPDTRGTQGPGPSSQNVIAVWSPEVHHLHKCCCLHEEATFRPVQHLYSTHKVRELSHNPSPTQ
jgi:hypothetical protein